MMLPFPSYEIMYKQAYRRRFDKSSAGSQQNPDLPCRLSSRAEVQAQAGARHQRRPDRAHRCTPNVVTFVGQVFEGREHFDVVPKLTRREQVEGEITA